MSENLQTNRKIGVIGDKDSVLGFMAVGFRVFMRIYCLSSAVCWRRSVRSRWIGPITTIAAMRAA